MDFEESVSNSPSPSKAQISRGRINLPNIPAITIRNMIKNTIIPYVSTDYIASWLESKSDSDLKEILDTYFVEISPTSEVYNELRKEVSVSIGDTVTSIFIIAHALANETVTGYSGSVDTYKKVLVDVINYMKSLFRVIKNIMQSRIASNILIAQITNKEVYVYGPLLDKYFNTEMENGSKPKADAILGSAISTNPIRSVGGVISNHDNLVKTWEKYVNIWRSQVKSRFHKELTNIIFRVIKEDAYHVGDWESSLREDYGYNYAAEMEALYDDIKNNLDTDNFHGNQYGIVTDLVLEYRFPYAKSTKFFRLVDSLSKEHGNNVPPEDILAMASIQYVTSHLLDRTYF